MIKPKYYYFFIPFSFVIVCIIACFNLFIIMKKKEAVLNLFYGFVVAIFYEVTVDVIGKLFSLDVLVSWWPLFYFYFISIIFTVFEIRMMERIAKE